MLKVKEVLRKWQQDIIRHKEKLFSKEEIEEDKKHKINENLREI
jgi:hypothetical protein